MLPAISELIDGFILFKDDTKAYNIIYRMNEGEFTILKIVENLGKYLTSDENIEIQRALKLITRIISSHINNITFDETRYFVKYFLSLLSGNYAQAPLLINGVFSLMCNNGMSKEKIEIFVNSLKELDETMDTLENGKNSFIQLNFDMQLLKQPERYLIHKIINYILKNSKLEWLQEFDSNGKTYFESIKFLPLYIQIIYGEKDPRNLVIIFENSHFILSNTPSLGDNMEEFFEVTACYYPIDYKPPPPKTLEISAFDELNPSQVEGGTELLATSDNLSAGLRSCLTARPEFMEYLLPLLVEKLESALPSAKTEVFRTLSAILQSENGQIWRAFDQSATSPDTDFWRQLSRLILSTSNSFFDPRFWPFDLKGTLEPKLFEIDQSKASRSSANEIRDLELSALRLVHDIFSRYGRPLLVNGQTRTVESGAEKAFLDPFVRNCLHQISCQTADLMNESIPGHPTGDEVPLYTLNSIDDDPIAEGSINAYSRLSNQTKTDSALRSPLKLLVATWSRPSSCHKSSSRISPTVEGTFVSGLELVVKCLGRSYDSIRRKLESAVSGRRKDDELDLVRVGDAMFLFLAAFARLCHQRPADALLLGQVVPVVCESVFSSLFPSDRSGPDLDDWPLGVASKLKLAAPCLPLASMGKRDDPGLSDRARGLALSCFSALNCAIKGGRPGPFDECGAGKLMEAIDLFVPSVCRWYGDESYAFLNSSLDSISYEREDATPASIELYLCKSLCLHLCDPVASQSPLNDLEWTQYDSCYVKTLLLRTKDIVNKLSHQALNGATQGTSRKIQFLTSVFHTIYISWARSLEKLLKGNQSSSLCDYYVQLFVYVLPRYHVLCPAVLGNNDNGPKAKMLKFDLHHLDPTIFDVTSSIVCELEKRIGAKGSDALLVETATSARQLMEVYKELVRDLVATLFTTLTSLLLTSSSESPEGGGFANEPDVITESNTIIESCSRPFYQLPIYMIEKIMGTQEGAPSVAKFLDLLSRLLCHSISDGERDSGLFSSSLLRALTSIVGACLSARANVNGDTGGPDAYDVHEFLCDFLQILTNVPHSHFRHKHGRQMVAESVGSLLGCIVRYDSGCGKAWLPYTDQLLAFLQDRTLSSDAAAHGLAAIFVVPPSTFRVSPFWKQKLFTYLTPRLLQGYKEHPGLRNNYCVAISSLVTNLPRVLVVSELSKIFPILVDGLKVGDGEESTGNKAEILLVLVELVSRWPFCISTFVSSLVDNLLPLLVTPRPDTNQLKYPDMETRRIACQLLTILPAKYPIPLLVPKKPCLLKCLKQLRDDPKRLVRKEATKALNAWHLLGAGKNALL